jgi:hypothetical protein
MAEDDADRKTLEMRVAALEDKLANVHITEAEMRAFQKVSALLAGAQAAGVAETPAAQAVPSAGLPTTALSPIVCVLPRARSIVLRQFCFECTCGPCNCAPGGGFFGGGGFGTLGM